MKTKINSKYLLISIFALAMLFPTLALAETKVPTPKTQAEINAYKAKLRAEKADQIEAYKKAAREGKASDIEAQRATAREEKKGLLEVRTASREARRAEIQKKRCEVVGNMIKTRVENFENNKQHHVDVYNRVNTKLTTAVDKLQEKGYDTTQLEADIKKLDSLAKKYASEYVYFISLIRGSEQYVCGQSDGKYKDSLKEAREQLKVVHEARKAFTDFYKTNIRNDIKDLRNQRPTTTTNL